MVVLPHVKNPPRIAIGNIVLLCSLSAEAHSLHKRDTTPDVVSDIKTSKRGILVKNNKITFCEVGLFSNLGGAVSADCLDYTAGNKLNKATNYTVYVDDGIDGKADKYRVQNITVHPEFNPTTRANNIATLRFNNGKNATWFNNIGITRETYWGKMVYTRSTITDLKTMKWEDPDFVYDPASEDSTCDSMSVLYNANSYDFTCIGDYAKSPGSNLTPCSTPYGTAYTYINNTLYPVGFYSYSSAVGDVSANGLCDASSVRNYYLVLSDWMVYVAKVANLDDFRWYPIKVDSLPIYSPNYTLRDPGVSDPDKYSIVGGNFYKDQGVFTTYVDPDDEASSTELPESSTSGHTNDGGDDTMTGDDTGDLDTYGNEDGVISSDDGAGSAPNDGNNSGKSAGSNKKAIIIGVVFAFVGGVAIATVLFFLVRRWRRNRRLAIEDPVARATMEDMEDVDSPRMDNNYFAGNIYNQRHHLPSPPPPPLNILVNTYSEDPPVYDDDTRTRGRRTILPPLDIGKLIGRN
ncbi:hypothetical protein H4217_001335 [Coemansia sp. RSA 1939]|nr:hypothetical protein H4217_001335 [Coemansia sp. RSA 1939]